MRIKRIAIKKYKNLVDFECEFSDSNISAFIGANGSGKSNLLEVITDVFSISKKYCNNNGHRALLNARHGLSLTRREGIDHIISTVTWVSTGSIQ